MLAATLWMPFIIRVGTTDAKTSVENGLATVDAMPRAARMADRAHQNLLEQALPFAGLILVNHALGVSSAATVAAAWTFLALRLTHAAIMLLDIRQMPVRPIVFTAAWLCTLALGIGAPRLG